MPNPLQIYANPAVASSLYKAIQEQVKPEDIIFHSMQQISQRRGFAFNLPTTPAECKQKHQEIEQFLTRYPNVLNKQGLIFDLIEEIQVQLRISGQDFLAGKLCELIIQEFKGNFKIHLSIDNAWLVEWVIELDTNGIIDSRSISAIAYQVVWGNIVPWTVVQYLNSAILLYKQRAFATALVLLSIAVEATLRDILSTRGYSFVSGASKVDVYDFSQAQVNVSSGGYDLTFLGIMPKAPSDLSSISALPLEISIRREINQAKNRVDLLIKAPPCLIDHWSSNRIIQRGQLKSIGGLGEALRVAREVEHIITPSDLPIDVDEVLKAVRNNLIHLSNDSMELVLPQYASMSTIGAFTLENFINTPNLVFDLIADIPRFVNDQYVKLWKARIHI